MKLSTDHILTTHVGSLPRPPDLLAMLEARETGRGFDEAVFEARLAAAVREIVKEHVYFTFEVEEEGGFRRVPEVGYGNFLWASDFPGMDSPWPNSKAMGHAPAEAALGKAALDQLVFDNTVNLYKIPVTEVARRAAE